MPLSPSISAMAGRSSTMRGTALRVHAAGADAADVLRQAEHAVAIGALQVRLRHQPGDVPASAAGTPAAW